MSAKQGKPFCKAAGEFLRKEDVEGQCGACCHIRYVGCPDFLGKTGYHEKAKKYLRWWHGETKEDE